MAEENREDYSSLLKQYLNSIRQHITGLSVRRYQDMEGLEAPDFVLMFMPIEGAYALALQEDSELHEFAWNKRIALVGPWNLYATLRTVGSIWRIDRQNRNAVEIAKRGGALYDKFSGFLEDLKKMGDQIIGLQKSYDQAKSKLGEGRGNLLKQVEDLKKLGAKASKSPPSEFSSEEQDTSISATETPLTQQIARE